MNPSERSPWPTLGALAVDRAGTGGDQSFLTFHDVETGERTELGHATFANWVAKTANLLGEDLALAPGSVVAVRAGVDDRDHVGAERGGGEVPIRGGRGDEAALGRAATRASADSG
jgi:hypothetical protein